MKAILIGILVLALVVGAAWLYRDFYVKREVRKLAFRKYEIIEPLMQKLASKEDISETEIMILAKDPSMRSGVFRALETYNMKNLFPTEYANHEKAAESFLVSWLEFPTELGIAPDEIELLEKITLNATEELDYYVFKYRTKTRLNWMVGVSGPYKKEHLLYEAPLRVFSRFKTVDSISPENEVRWVHENINPNG
jgi:hypothetical protein